MLASTKAICGSPLLALIFTLAVAPTSLVNSAIFTPLPPPVTFKANSLASWSILNNASGELVPIPTLPALLTSILVVPWLVRLDAPVFKKTFPLEARTIFSPLLEFKTKLSVLSSPIK